MNITFTKYHALGNDFLIIESQQATLSDKKLESLARQICDRYYGVGADGIIYLSKSANADAHFDIYNSDGSWAEKSGNGLRIAGSHLHLNRKKQRKFCFETSVSLNDVEIIRKTSTGLMVKTDLGKPEFRTDLIPVQSKQPYMIQATLKLSDVTFPVTCLSVGNPHTVLFVDNFDFDWETLGADIETHKAFPNNTNVEFVQIINRHKIKLRDWERGAGATGSSGTGAAAAVTAGVINGQLERKCEVVFETGSLFVHWREDDDIIELTGEVVLVFEGVYNFK